MELETVFTDNKWLIFTELARKSLAPSEIAKKTGMSISNVSIQLRLLEALDFVEQKKSSGEIGRKEYSLKKSFAYLVLCSPPIVGKKTIKMDYEKMPFFSAWLINDALVPYYILKFCMEYENVFRETLAFGYLGLSDEEIEFLLIHDNPNSLQWLSQKELFYNNRKLRLKTTVLTKDDFEKGIKRNDEYFKSLLKKVVVVADRENILRKER